MYSKNMLTGIFLAKANGHISITKNNEIMIGYRTKLSINVRGSSQFLQAIQRSLVQYGIESNYKEKQNKRKLVSFFTSNEFLRLQIKQQKNWLA